MLEHSPKTSVISDLTALEVSKNQSLNTMSKRKKMPIFEPANIEYEYLKFLISDV